MVNYLRTECQVNHGVSGIMKESLMSSKNPTVALSSPEDVAKTWMLDVMACRSWKSHNLVSLRCVFCTWLQHHARPAGLLQFQPSIIAATCHRQLAQTMKEATSNVLSRLFASMCLCMCECCVLGVVLCGHAARWPVSRFQMDAGPSNLRHTFASAHPE